MVDKRAKLLPLRVTLSTPSTDRPWRALWDWLLGPTDQEKAASVEEHGRDQPLDDNRESPEEDKNDCPSPS